MRSSPFLLLYAPSAGESAQSQRCIFLHQNDKHTPMFIFILIGLNRNAHVLVGDFNCGDKEWRNMQLQGSR